MMPCQPFHRLFFALRPPPSAAAYIRDGSTWLGPGKWVRPEHFHVTLNILDDWPFLPLELLAAMIAVGDRMAAKPFRVIFDQLNGSARSIVLRPSERIATLCEFQASLAAALARAGIATRRDARFSPHLTLIYRSRPDFTAAVDAVSWTATEFLLIESLVGWTEHKVRGRWTLG
jgi:2'-5' RNA ligase